MSPQQLHRSDVPEDSLEGLEGFSHAWVIYLFHANTDLGRIGGGGASGKGRVRVPRLGGVRAGVLATRSPHRPLPIGAHSTEYRAHSLWDGRLLQNQGCQAFVAAPIASRCVALAEALSACAMHSNMQTCKEPGTHAEVQSTWAVTGRGRTALTAPFAMRLPGLSVAAVLQREGRRLWLGGVDLVDGTPGTLPLTLHTVLQRTNLVAYVWTECVDRARTLDLEACK